MHSPSQLDFNVLKLRPHRVAGVFRLSWKRPRRDFPQMNVNPRKAKVSGLPSPALLAVDRREEAKLNQAGLVRVERQRKARIASRKRRASPSCSKPTITSSA